MRAVGENVFLFVFGDEGAFFKALWVFNNKSLIVLANYDSREFLIELDFHVSLFWVKFLDLKMGTMIELMGRFL